MSSDWPTGLSRASVHCPQMLFVPSNAVISQSQHRQDCLPKWRQFVKCLTDRDFFLQIKADWAENISERVLVLCDWPTHLPWVWGSGWPAPGTWTRPWFRPCPPGASSAAGRTPVSRRNSPANKTRETESSGSLWTLPLSRGPNGNSRRVVDLVQPRGRCLHGFCAKCACYNFPHYHIKPETHLAYYC